MTSLAKESLSPLIKTASARRRSLELCQQIGNQLLSPTTLTTFFSPKQKTPSPTKSEKSCSSQGSSNKSPFKLIDSASKSLSPSSVFYGSDENEIPATSSANYHYKRRASDSLWIDTFPKLEGLVETEDAKNSRARRRSLTTQHELEFLPSRISDRSGVIEAELYSAFGKLDGKPSGSKRRSNPLITCNVIPPTPINKPIKKKTGQVTIPLLKFPLKRSSSGSGSESDDDIINNEVETDSKKVKVVPFKESLIDPASLPECSLAGAKHDISENLVSFVALRWNLTLSPEERLGKGSFGTVLGGIYKGQEVAVKVLKTTSVKKAASLFGEENALKLPFHSHIARTLDIFRIEPDIALIVMEKMPKGSLLNLINDPNFEMSCSQAITFSKQIALALMFCHRQGLLHLDVKPQNILVDLMNCCKLSDFGSSKIISELSRYYKYTNFQGTIPYTAPELFRGSIPTEKCDVYSFAITMWQILYRETPYKDVNEHAVIYRVVSHGLRPKNYVDGNNNYRSTLKDEKENMLIKKYSDLYTESWHSCPDLRPTMTDIHKYLIKIQLEQLS